MQNPESSKHQLHHQSNTEVVGNDRTTDSGPLSGPLNKKGDKKSSRFNIQDSSASSGGASNDDYVKITFDVEEDSVAVHSAKTLEKKSSFGSSVVRNSSLKVKQVSNELKRSASLTRQPQPRSLDLTKCAFAHALKGLKFISKTDGGAA
ncbi:respiratory burst oxidase homolog C [Olea europaea subsp. europaea]|uniref:Respiratory burst oxidase homolog C n=1 Tax=Olea europaea subsp. europaea TaxID=158383 RepID=A0A8S0PA18_OLEEU|nr:respiratory burst oxidase homolog C [Olea europaea subsp. europaea]